MVGPPRGPGTEQGPPHAHHGRALRQRHLQVVAHPHRPDGQAQAVGQPGHQGEAGPGLLGRARAGHRHEPGHVEILLPQGRHQVGAPGPGGHAAPTGQAGHVHLDQHGGPGRPPAMASPSSTRLTVCQHAHHRGQAGHLSPLHGAEEVPHVGAGTGRPSTSRAALATSSSA